MVPNATLTIITSISLVPDHDLYLCKQKLRHSVIIILEPTLQLVTGKSSFVGETRSMKVTVWSFARHRNVGETFVVDDMADKYLAWDHMPN